MSPRGGRTTRGTKTDAQRHWHKGLQFAQAARLGLHEDLPAPACSNAIFATMHAADALCIRYLGFRSSGQSHHETLDLLATVDQMPAAANASFQRHLGALLDVKSLVQYTGDEFLRRDAEAAIKHMDRAYAAIRDLVSAWGWPSPKT